MIVRLKKRLKQKNGFLPRILTRKCTGCEECVIQCPHNALGMTYYDDYEYAALAFADRCIGCGRCERVCMNKAIEMVNPTELIRP